MKHLELLPQLLVLPKIPCCIHLKHTSRKLTLGDSTEGSEALILGSPLLVMKHRRRQAWEERVYLVLQGGEPRQVLKQRP